MSGSGELYKERVREENRKRVGGIGEEGAGDGALESGRGEEEKGEGKAD